MNELYQNSHPEVESFDERLDIFFREIELAIKWQRPSILLAIYPSEVIHAEVEAALESKQFSGAQEIPVHAFTPCYIFTGRVGFFRLLDLLHQEAVAALTVGGFDTDVFERFDTAHNVADALWQQRREGLAGGTCRNLPGNDGAHAVGDMAGFWVMAE